MKAPLRKQLQAWVRLFQLGGELRSYITPRRGRIALAATLAVLSALLHMAEPWALQIVFDHAILNQPSPIPGFDPLAAVGGDRMALLAWAAVALVVLAALSGTLYYAQSLLVARVGQEIIRDLREDVFHHLLRLSLPFHRKHDTGDLLMRLTGDMVFLREMILALLVTLTSELSILLLALVFMATVSWPLTLTTAVIVPVLVVLFRLFQRRMVAAARQQRRREGRLAQQIADVLIAIPMIQSFTAESAEDDRFRRVSKRSERAGLRAARLEAGMQRLVELAIALGTAAVLWFGVREILAGQMTPGVFLVFLAYLRMLWKPVRKLAKVTERTSRAAAATERVLEVLKASRDVKDPKEAVPAPPFAGAIRFSRVSFAYENGTEALSDITFDIAPGEQVALVGPTGCGKSTLFSLLLRFHRPSSGRIYFDQAKVKDFTVASVRQQVAYLPQEPFLVAGSIRENLLYGKPDATDEEMWDALESAGLGVFVRGLPDRLDTELAARGQSLSGGQKQRLAIARALLKDAPILLLDEPTTGLDARTEREVLESLETLRRGRTTITIAHRLSTVQTADRVLVMEQGRLVANDRPERLRDLPGLFRELMRSERSQVGEHRQESELSNGAERAKGAEQSNRDARRNPSEREAVVERGCGPEPDQPATPGSETELRQLLERPDEDPLAGIPGLVFDPALRGIERLREEQGPKRFLKELAQLGPVSKRASVCGVKQRIGQRALVRVASENGGYYVKFFRGRSGDWRLRTYRSLETSASAAGILIPRLAGSIDRYRAMVFEEVAGSPLLMNDGTGKGERFFATGAAIARFHAHATLPERAEDQNDERLRLDRAAERAVHRGGASAPEWQERWIRAADAWWRAYLEPPGDSVSRALGPQQDRVAIHGDFYPSQVLQRAGAESSGATHSSIAILDWDAAVTGHAERDLGNFVAHIDLACAMHQVSTAVGAELRRAFTEGYLSVRPFDAARFAWYHAGSLLRLARLYSDPEFGPYPPNPPALAEALLEAAEAVVQTLEIVPMHTRTNPSTNAKPLGAVAALFAFGLIAATTARAGLAPDSWGGFVAAGYESRPIDQTQAIDPEAGTGDSRYWFAEPEEWGGALRLWGKWKFGTFAGKARVTAAYERKAWTESDILSRDLFEFQYRHALSSSSDLELDLEYSPQVYLRHRADKDAPAGAPRFRPEAYAELGGELAWLRRWGGVQSSLFASYSDRDETEWFEERDRTSVGGGVELQIPLGAATLIRPAYEYEDSRSRNEPDLGSDLSFDEHSLGIRAAHTLSTLGTSWRLEGASEWGLRAYSTSDSLDTSRFGRHDRIHTGSARVVWLRGAWRPFAYWERYARSMDLRAEEADANDDESERTLVRLGIEFEL